MKISLPFTKSTTLFTAFILMFLCSAIHLPAQNGIRFNSADAYKGYTLATAENQGRTYLLDNCGMIVNEWSSTFPDHYCRLTDEGNLLFIQNNRIFERSWDDNPVKTINPNSNNLFLDYEVMKLENGNYLAVARRIVNSSEFTKIGWNPDRPIPDRIDGIVEINPDGDIVWEWNIKDHTIQDEISTAPNYGVVENHPERVDVDVISSYDWQFGESFMINGMDYNAELDQIIISVRKVSEVMIIDHSTTTEEAQGSTGGRYGKGGDILYRWGNPQNYGQGTDSDQVLYFQHNPNWVRYGEHKGKIIMFNNGLTRTVPGFGEISSVHIIDPPILSDGSYEFENNSAFGPEQADVTIDAPNTGLLFSSSYTSGAQVLPNGNVYITVGRSSDFIEVAPNNEVVWDYGMSFSFYIFRSEKYAPDFPGFAGRDLTASGTIESPSSSYDCSIFTSTKDLNDEDSFAIYFDPFVDILTLNNIKSSNNQLVIKNMQGQIIRNMNNVDDNSQINLAGISTGMYSVTLYDFKHQKKRSQKFVKY